MYVCDRAYVGSGGGSGDTDEPWICSRELERHVARRFPQSPEPRLVGWFGVAVRIERSSSDRFALRANELPAPSRLFLLCFVTVCIAIVQFVVFVKEFRGLASWIIVESSSRIDRQVSSGEGSKKSI